MSGGTRREYDAELLVELLRDAGLPEERIADAVVETVSYRVNPAFVLEAARSSERELRRGDPEARGNHC